VECDEPGWPSQPVSRLWVLASSSVQQPCSGPPDPGLVTLGETEIVLARTADMRVVPDQNDSVPLPAIHLSGLGGDVMGILHGQLGGLSDLWGGRAITVGHPLFEEIFGHWPTEVKALGDIDAKGF
jgi:hypothetical protein